MQLRSKNNKYNDKNCNNNSINKEEIITKKQDIKKI